MEIYDDPRIKEFLQSRSLKKRSIEGYIQFITKYCNLIKLTPSQLIEEAEEDEDQRIRMRKRRVKKHLLDFKEYLIENDYSEYVIRNAITTIRSFYSEFEIELPRLKINRQKTTNETIEDIPNKEHILTALTYANLKYRAIILIMLSSGMGSAEIRILTYKDFLNAISEYCKLLKSEQFDIDLIEEKLQEKNVIGTWQIHRIKTGMPYTTFSTPESINAILIYLKNEPPKNLETPLFRSRNKKIARNTFHQYFIRLNKECGFGKRGRQIFFRSHSLRKYFATTLYTKGIPQLTIDWWMGHKIEKTTEAYFKGDISALKKEYLQIVDDLSIEKVKVKTVTTKEYDQLLRDSREKDDKIASLEKRMELMDNMLKNVLEKQLDNEKGI